jgi:hypothetical protein
LELSVELGMVKTESHLSLRHIKFPFVAAPDPSGSKRGAASQNLRSRSHDQAIVARATVKPESEPGSCEQNRQAEREQPDSDAIDFSARAKPDSAYGEDRDSYWLEHHALYIPGPTAQPAPDGHDDSGEPGSAAENAVEDSDPASANGPPLLIGTTAGRSRA